MQTVGIPNISYKGNVAKAAIISAMLAGSPVQAQAEVKNDTFEISPKTEYVSDLNKVYDDVFVYGQTDTTRNKRVNKNVSDTNYVSLTEVPDDNNENNIKIITGKICGNFIKQVDRNNTKEIFKAFDSSDFFDEYGNSKRDNKLTGDEITCFFETLSPDVKEKFQNWYKINLDVESIIDNTQTKDSKGQKNIYNREKYSQAIKKINSDNIGYLFSQNGRSAIKDDIITQLLNPYFDDNKNTNPRTQEEIMEDCKHIRHSMSEWCKKHGVDASELDNTEINYNPQKEDFKNGKPDNMADDILLGYFNLMKDAIETQYLKETMERDISFRLQAAIDERYDEAIKNKEKLTTKHPKSSADQKRDRVSLNEIDEYYEKYKNEIDSNEQQKDVYNNLMWMYGININDSGNGKIDKTARQRANNCGLLAVINAFANTPDGKAFLEKNIKKDPEKHIFAVHIWAAEDSGIQDANEYGIFTFTEKEILDIQHEYNGLVSGDGDVAAYALAVEKYMRNVQLKNPENDEMYYSSNFSPSLFLKMLTGVTESENNENIPLGISYYDKKDGPLKNFDEIYKYAETKKAAIVLKTKLDPTKKVVHAISVVGVDGDCLLVQESNNYESVLSDKFEIINKLPPTYKVSKEAYEKYITGQSIFRWE